MKLRTTGDGSRTLHSERYGQTFHSMHGAVAETRHVFLEASGIGPRLRAGQPCRVLEIGFGTGLNFWLTADEALAAAAPLEFLSLEQELLPAATVRELGFESHLRSPALLTAYLAFRESLGSEIAPVSQSVALAEGVGLSLLVGRAEEQQLPVQWADAIYHDAFSPDVNPELWNLDFLQKLHCSLRPGGRLVTYLVRGSVRRALQEAGFSAQKKPGPPGGKREMLLAGKD